MGDIAQTTSAADDRLYQLTRAAYLEKRNLGKRNFHLETVADAARKHAKCVGRCMCAGHLCDALAALDAGGGA